MSLIKFSPVYIPNAIGQKYVTRYRPIRGFLVWILLLASRHTTVSHPRLSHTCNSVTM